MARIPRGGNLPLSFSQRRLWFLEKLDGNLAAYHIPALFRIGGDLDRAALEQALNLVTARHEALRTAIKEVAGEPCQDIAAALSIALPIIDLSGLPAGAAAAEWRRLAAIDASAPYNLTQAPLWRAQLVKLAAQDHVLLLNFHHIIADGSSLAIFYRELASSYAAYRGNVAAPDNAAAAAVRRLRRLAAPVAKLTGLRCRAGLLAAYPSRFIRAGIDPDRFPPPGGAQLPWCQDDQALTGRIGCGDAPFQPPTGRDRVHDLTRGIQRVAVADRAVGPTSSSAPPWLGATAPRWKVSSASSSIVLPLRFDLGDNPSFIGLLRQVREVCLNGYSNQELPFDKLVEEVNPARDTSRNPLFDILFNGADLSERSFSLAGCKIEKFMEGASSAKFDLVLSAPEIAGSFELTVSLRCRTLPPGADRCRARTIRNGPRAGGAPS